MQILRTIPGIKAARVSCVPVGMRTLSMITHCSMSGYCAPVRLRCFALRGDATFPIQAGPGRFNTEHLRLKRVKGIAILLEFIIASYNRNSSGPRF